MIPAPGRVLLRPVETESTVGRIHLLDSTLANWTPNQYEVVLVGPPAKCPDDPDDCTRTHWFDNHPKPCIEGDWVLVRHRAVSPTEDDHLFIAWQDDILAILSLRTALQ